MKNIKAIMGIWLLSMSIPLSIMAQPGVTSNRNVVFIHGLMGSSSSWQAFTDDFTSGVNERRMNADRAQHGTSGGINFAASEINSPNFGSQSLVIGHSMGGVIARHLDLNNMRTIGGIINVGGPLDGAPAANALVDGRAAAAVSNAATQMIRGPLATLGFISPIITVAGNAIAADRLPGEINKLLNVNTFGGSQTVNDLKVGGAGIEQDKNANPTTTPKVSIWGNENSPTHWNIATTGTGINVPEIADDVADFYNTMFYVHIGTGSFNFWNPWGWFSFWAAGEWNAGANWVEYQSESDWNHLIGSDMVVQQCVDMTYTYCTYPDSRCAYTPQNWMYCVTRCTDYTRNVCFNVHNNGVSDAFIPAISQQGQGSKSWRTNGAVSPSFEAPGADHLEERDPNNAGMQSAFERVFTLEGGLPDVFRVNRR
jgi:pimeloyl-ACP methyl ester carboxylesterase